MTQLPPTTLTHDHATPERGLSLADRLREGEEFAVTFGGQGTDWFATLRELLDEDPDTSRLDRSWSRSRRRLVAPVAGQLAAALPRPFEPQAGSPRTQRPSARRHRRRRARPARRAAHPAGHPRPARRRGPRPRPDRARSPPSATPRASSASPRFAGRRERRRHASDVELMAIARLIGAAATIVGRRAGLVAHGEDSPMLAVSGATARRGRGADRRGLRAPATTRRRRRRQRPAPRGRQRHPRRPAPPAHRRREAHGRRGRRDRGQDRAAGAPSPRPSSRSRSPSASTTPRSPRPSSWSATGPRPAASTPAWPSTSPTPSAWRPSTGRASSPTPSAPTPAGSSTSARPTSPPT